MDLLIDNLTSDELGVLHDALVSYLEDLGEDVVSPEGVAVKSLLSTYFGYDF